MLSSYPDITAILNIHNEGFLAENSLKSLIRAKESAEAFGLSVEVLIAADNVDDTTQKFLDIASVLASKVVKVTLGDLGLARNAAVEASSGRFIAFLDGDDLWSENWLVKAYQLAINDPQQTVWHPESNLFFGPSGVAYWMIHYDIDTEPADWVSLGLRNHWTSLSFGAREIYKNVPYPHINLNRGYGFEDWAWNAESVAAGYYHRAVTGTAHLIRVKERSLLRKTMDANALMTPTSLFRKKLTVSNQ